MENRKPVTEVDMRRYKELNSKLQHDLQIAKHEKDSVEIKLDSLVAEIERLKVASQDTSRLNMKIEELKCKTVSNRMTVTRKIEELDVGLRVRRLRRDGYEKIECRSSAAAKASSTTTTGFLDPNDVRNLHIELTDKCNAACPQW